MTGSLQAAQGTPPPQCNHPPGTYNWTDYFDGSPQPLLNDGDDAKIAPNDVVYLDQVSPNLRFLQVEGTLIFESCLTGRDLRAASILVTGELRIGDSQEPFLKTAYITLIDDYDPPDATELAAAPFNITDTDTQGAIENRGLVVCNAGKLILHGEPRSHSWLRLNATATTGATSITLEASTDWEDPDEIVLASSDFDYRFAETFSVTSAGGGSLLTISGATQVEHWGVTETFKPTGGLDAEWTVDERCEVALLSRNIVVRGESQEVSYGGGTYTKSGHIFIHNEDSVSDVPVFEASWVDFQDLGIEDEISRYPVHFHKLGDASGKASLKYCTVRDGHHGGIIVHDTAGVVLEGNVLYNIYGVGVYFEDYYPSGTNQDCVLKNNLAIRMNQVEDKDPSQKFGEDDDPVEACFYVRNPRNQIVGNVAAGSRGYGFYLSPRADDSGWSWPDETSGNVPWKFEDNRVHSCRLKGIYQDTESKPTEQIFLRTQAYKIRKQGMWIRTLGKAVIDGDTTGTGSVRGWTADCNAGIYPATSGLRGQGEGHVVIKIGSSGNRVANVFLSFLKPVISCLFLCSPSFGVFLSLRDGLPRPS